MNKKSVWKSYRFPIILIIAIVLGCVTGLLWGEGASAIKFLGDIFINLMFCIVVPLVFVSISSAIANMQSKKRLGRILSTTIITFIVTGVICAVLMIVICRIFDPLVVGNVAFETTEPGTGKTVNELITGFFTVSDFPSLFSRSNMLPLIVAAILFGFGVSYCGGPESKVGQFLSNLSDVILRIVQIVMYLAPIGLFAYFAYIVGTFGSSIIEGFGKVLIIYYPLCFLYLFIAFPLYARFGGGKGAARVMFQHLLRPAVTALGTCSSVATIPTNMEVAQETGISKDVSDIVLPLGATMHMDGTCFSGIMKIAFLFSFFGIPFTGFGTWALAVAVAVFSSVAMSGVPGGGFIGELIICSLFFPNNMAVAYPILVVIGTIIDPPATMINSSGDYVVSFIVERFVDGKDWLQKKLHADAAVAEK